MYVDIYQVCMEMHTIYGLLSTQNDMQMLIILIIVIEMKKLNQFKTKGRQNFICIHSEKFLNKRNTYTLNKFSRKTGEAMVLQHYMQMTF